MDREQCPGDVVLQRPTKVFSRCTLKKRFDFLKTAKEGRKIVTPSLVVQVNVKKEDEGGIRFGFTATRKVGSSVIRNRARRRLRAVVDLIGKEALLRAGSYVLIARRSTITVPFEVLIKDFRKALVNVF